MTAARRENARMLAAALGIEEQNADRLLDAAVLITCAEGADRLANYVQGLLARTLTNIQSTPDPQRLPDLEILVGGARPRSSARTIGVGVDGFRIEVTDGPCPLLGGSLPIVELAAACYAASAAVHRAIGLELSIPLRMPIRIDLEQLYGDAVKRLVEPVEIGTCVMAGAGAIGNATLAGLSVLDVHGTIHICDPDNVSGGNLNRCWWFSDVDLGKPKADQLALHARASLPGVSLLAHVETVRDFVAKSGVSRIDTLIVGVDSRRARRSLQNEMPRRVFDASTTGITEIVVHFNTITSSDACMSCIYYEAPREAAHEAHVAEVLGVDAAMVRSNFISADAARAIAEKYPHLDRSELEGLAYDSLFKELCGKGQIKHGAVERVLAPFAFVSVLGGVLLAIEIAIRSHPGTAATDYNYWRVSPWAAPSGRMRERRRRREYCEFCGNPILRTVVRQLWG